MFNTKSQKSSLKKNEYNVIGLMSGTSLDGLDIAYIRFSLETCWNFKIIKASTIEYPRKLSQQLLQAPQYSGLELSLLDIRYGEWIGKEVKKFTTLNQLNIDFIASHGHTVFHQPELQLCLQLGHGAAIAVHSGFTCINQFRNTDVCHGGQGAPLVPIGDHLLFSDYTACINLGGFANISLLKNQQRIAFDICPCNLLINRYAQTLGFAYDKDGEIAKNGNIHLPLLEKLNNLDYYVQPPPKSLGFEWVAQNMQVCINEYEVCTKDLISTLTEHAAIQIANCLNRFSTELKWTPSQKANILFTGGGTFNIYLMEKICRHANIELKDTEPLLISFKESLIFGFLGVLRIREEHNSLSSVTGARCNNIGGAIYLP